jgi:predicted transcriptional regulator
MCGHTRSMKVAVSIPDDVFEHGEALAKRMKLPRSKIYAQALEAYVANQDPDLITSTLDEILQETGPQDTRFVRKAAFDILKKVEW